VIKMLYGPLAVAALVSATLVSGTPDLRAQARTSSGSSFTLGVLRRDGVIVPFASYDTNRWVNHWPAPGRREDIPISIAESPKGWWLRDRPIATWTVWPMRGDSQVVHVKNPVNLMVECDPHVGLQTDYVSTSPPVPPKMQPYPKDGLATAGDVLVEPVDILDGKSPEWAAVSSDVAAKVTAAESAWRPTLPFRPSTEAQRAKQAFVLEVLFRSPGARPGTSLLYFEGVKRYARGPAGLLDSGARSDLLIFAAGYVIVDPQASPKVSLEIAESDSKRQGLLYTMVLGSFRLDGKLFWAVQRSGWGHERFEILEVAEPEPKPVFKTQGGNCH